MEYLCWLVIYKKPVNNGYVLLELIDNIFRDERQLLLWPYVSSSEKYFSYIHDENNYTKAVEFTSPYVIQVLP